MSILRKAVKYAYVSTKGALALDDSYVPKLGAVMSAFHPDSAVLENIKAVANQVDHLWIIDDSGDSHWEGSGLITAECLPRNAVLLRNKQNIGIAASLNRGVSAALAEGVDAIVTVDQDTFIPPSFVSQLANHLEAARVSNPSIRGVAPEFVNSRGYECLHSNGAGSCSVETIQSGLLLDSRVFNEVGLFREELFIDGVEADFLIRMHQKALHVQLVEGLNLTHPLGSPITVRVLNMDFTSSNHLPFRRFYITRNRLILLRDYRHSEPAWARVVAKRLIYQSICAALFEPARVKKIFAMLKGAGYALTSRMGRL
jgi:rhamnosyltransferase